MHRCSRFGGDVVDARFIRRRLDVAGRKPPEQQAQFHQAGDRGGIPAPPSFMPAAQSIVLRRIINTGSVDPQAVEEVAPVKATSNRLAIREESVSGTENVDRVTLQIDGTVVGWQSDRLGVLRIPKVGGRGALVEGV